MHHLWTALVDSKLTSVFGRVHHYIGSPAPMATSLLELGAEDSNRIVSERKLRSTATWAIQDTKRLPSAKNIPWF